MQLGLTRNDRTLSTRALGMFRRWADAMPRNGYLRLDAYRIGRRVSATRRGLFIDCGSNVGQGFTQFSAHYGPDRFDYVLVEPNPHCLAPLQRAIAARIGAQGAEIIAKAAATSDGETRFFGLSDSEMGKLAQGGSTLRDHNGRLYAANERAAITVPTFSFVALLAERARRYDTIVLKMDIEGAEYDVLEHMIATGVHRHLAAAYVEFHAAFMAPPAQSRYQDREREIIRRFRADGVPLRAWM